MEQKSLRVLDANKTFFSKITTTITKLLIPTRVSLNSIMISMKRNTLLKTYYNYTLANEIDDVEKKEAITQKYEDTYALYLEAIDKFIMDSVYKKVKNNTASNFEREALSKYYMIVSLKDKQYLEYKYKKQEYLLKIDYETVSSSNKLDFIDKYNHFYVSKMDSLYKGLLKNYSVKLADTTSNKEENSDNTYNKVFDILENYISEILPIKIKETSGEEYRNIIEEYEKYETITIGKLDERDKIKKKMIILGISRYLFTHSLPLIAAEQCYNKLLSETREMIIKDTNALTRERTFKMLIELIEDYNIKLLSTKVYWEKPEKREEYKKFWENYKNIEKESQEKQKEILFLKYDIKQLNSKRDAAIIKIFKEKLVELGAIRQLKNTYITKGKYTKIKVS